MIETNSKGLPFSRADETSAEYLKRLDAWFAETYPEPGRKCDPIVRRQREKIGGEIESLRIALRRGADKRLDPNRESRGVASHSAMRAYAQAQIRDEIADEKHRREHPPSMMDILTEGMEGRNLEIAREVFAKEFADADESAPSKPVAWVDRNGRTMVDQGQLKKAAREARKSKKA